MNITQFHLLILGLMLAGCSMGEPLRKLEQNSLVLDPVTMSVEIKNYRPQDGMRFQHLFVSNFSVQASGGGLKFSTARDGMPDSLKVSLNPKYGFLPTAPESAVPGFSDLLLYSLGLDLSQQNLVYCSGNQLTSSSNDAFTYNDKRLFSNPLIFLGLRDCQKIYMGLNPNKYDNAGNGIPDYLKLRCGLNPANKNEAFVSTAGDGVANIDKCKQHIPVAESAYTMANQALAYRYASVLNDDGSMDFTVSNIALTNDGTENFLAIYLTETSETNLAPGLSSAFALVSDRLADQTLKVDWAVSGNRTNQEILVP